MKQTDPANENYLGCSFCGKSQEKARQLIASPTHLPRAYICHECITTFAAILEDDRLEAEPPRKTHV